MNHSVNDCEGLNPLPWTLSPFSPLKNLGLMMLLFLTKLPNYFQFSLVVHPFLDFSQCSVVVQLVKEYECCKQLTNYWKKFHSKHMSW